MIKDYVSLEKQVLGEVSIKNIYDHVLNITNETPYRIAGGGQDLKAAKYIKDMMTSYGLEVDLCEFETYNSYPGEGSLKVVTPHERDIECRACLHIEATPPGGFESELIYVGAGGEKDYKGKDVRGKTVLAEVSYSPATPEKARLAYRHGAQGLILMNWGTADQPLIPMRGLKAVWGNPTPETWNDIPRVYAVTTNRADGEYLKNLCLDGQVKVRLETTSIRQWGVVTQPIATLKPSKKTEESDQFVIVSGHLDAWDPGVTDNATGNAVMLELARVLSLYKDKIRRKVVFCFWNGHEIAEAAGSTYWVDSKWDQINQHAVAYLNIDSPGMKGTTYLSINSSPELSLFHGPVEERVLGQQGERLPLTRTGDQSFFGIGVPSVTGRFSHSKELVGEWNGATLGWWNHTREENLDKLDLDILEKESLLWTGYILELAIAPVLPHRFTPRAEDLAAKLKNIVSNGESPSGIETLASLSEKFLEQARWLDHQANELASRWEKGDGDSEYLETHTCLINKALLKLSRHLTAICSTVVGRYGQDSYGLSDLYAPVPMLAPLERYRILPVDSLERKLLVTKLFRIRNQMSDAFHNAIDEVKYIRMLLDK